MLMVLTFFAAPTLADDYHKEEQGKMSLEYLADTVVRIFPDALDEYAHLGRAIFQGRREAGDPGQELSARQKIGRNDPVRAAAGKSLNSAAARPEMRSLCIVQKIWTSGTISPLPRRAKQAGGDYLSANCRTGVAQLTYLLFLKMADERLTVSVSFRSQRFSSLCRCVILRASEVCHGGTAPSHAHHGAPEDVQWEADYPRS